MKDTAWGMKNYVKARCSRLANAPATRNPQPDDRAEQTFKSDKSARQRSDQQSIENLSFRLLLKGRSAAKHVIRQYKNQTLNSDGFKFRAANPPSIQNIPRHP